MHARIGLNGQQHDLHNNRDEQRRAKLLKKYIGKRFKNRVRDEEDSKSGIVLSS